MAKDYKHRANPKPPPPKRAPGWLWLLTGGVVALFVTFLLALRDPGDQQPVQARGPVSPLPDVAKRMEEAARLKKAKEESERKAQEEREAAEKARAARPRFQFYAVLPEREFIIPESEVKTRKQQERLGEKLPRGEVYMLQVASFKTAPEAERMKAQLALLGVQGRVEAAEIGTATWNRVKVGPFASIASADKTRALLRENHIDSVVQVQKSAPAAALPVPPSPPGAQR